MFKETTKMQYNEQIKGKIKREVRNKSIVFLAIFAVIAAVLAVLFTMRLQFWISVATLLLGGAFLFFLYVYWVPPVRYLRYQRELAAGQRRTSEVVFERFSEDRVLREGLWFYPVLTHDDEAYERIFYWDAEIPRAQIPQDTRVRIQSYGQNITSLEILS